MSKKQKLPPTGEGNKFDKIFKENLHKLIPAIIRRVLLLPPHQLENLPQIRLQTTLEREPDFLKKMYSSHFPDGCILHIEFEGKDEVDTDYRMLEYGGILLRKYKLPIEQHLIFLLGEEPKHIKGGVQTGHFPYSYSVHCLWQISYMNFINSDKQEEVLLSILAHHEGEPPETIIRLILDRLIELKGQSASINKFIRQLKMLSGLRKLQEETIQIIQTMSIDYDITQDVAYKQGKAEGIEKGIEKGIEQGIEKGIEQGIEQGIEKGETLKTIAAIINMAAKGFDVRVISEVLEVTEEFVQNILKQSEKKEEIISMLNKPRVRIETVAKKLNVMPQLVEVIAGNTGK